MSKEIATIEQGKYLVEVSSANILVDYVPRATKSGDLKWKFSLQEAVEVREKYLERIRETARSTKKEHNIAVLESLFVSCKIVECKEQ
jgi:hypothetical protein